MRILYVCNINPSLTITGAHQRTFLQVKLLKSFADVDILFLNSEEEISENDGITQVFLNNKVKNKYNKRMKQLLNLLPCSHFFIHPMDEMSKEYFEKAIHTKKYDFVFFRYIFSYMKCGAPQLNNMIMDIDDLPWQNSECIAQNKNNSILKRTYHSYRAFWVKYFCKQLWPKFKTIYFSNPKDMIGNNTSYLPNIPFINSDEELNITQNVVSESNPIVLFVGNLSHVPNYDGLNHFINHIWPQVTKVCPSTILRIVGRGLPKKLHERWSNIKNIELIGFVKSLNLVYQTASLVVSPIYAGAGTNIKVLEALAYGKVCVLSTFSYRGFETNFHNHQDLIVCIDDSYFAYSIIDVLQNSSKYKKMEQSGKKKVKQFYSEKRLKATFIKDLIMH